MGLDISHDAWQGPYSAFGRWRKVIARAVAADPCLDLHGGDAAWPVYGPEPQIKEWR